MRKKTYYLWRVFPAKTVIHYFHRAGRNVYTCWGPFEMLSMAYNKF